VFSLSEVVISLSTKEITTLFRFSAKQFFQGTCVADSKRLQAMAAIVAL